MDNDVKDRIETQFLRFLTMDFTTIIKIQNRGNSITSF